MVVCCTNCLQFNFHRLLQNGEAVLLFPGGGGCCIPGGSMRLVQAICQCQGKLWLDGGGLVCVGCLRGGIPPSEGSLLGCVCKDTRSQATT